MPEHVAGPEQPQAESQIARDIREMVSEMTDVDLIEQARLMIHDHFHPSTPPNGVTEHFFVLPGNPAEESVTSQDLYTTVREAYDSRGEMGTRGELIRVPQAAMYYLPRSGDTRLVSVGTSSCSTVIATKPDQVAIAHVSFSEREEMEPLLAKLKADGYDADSTWVTAATGPTQEAEAAERQDAFRDDEVLAHRHGRFGVEDYEQAGIPRDHILDYEYSTATDRVAGVTTTTFVGSETFVALLPDGTVRIVASSRTAQEWWNGRYRDLRIADGSTRVLGSAVLN